jgi:hypothetical protein
LSYYIEEYFLHRFEIPWRFENNLQYRTSSDSLVALQMVKYCVPFVVTINEMLWSRPEDFPTNKLTAYSAVSPLAEEHAVGFVHCSFRHPDVENDKRLPPLQIGL